ncbi:hypothetical protein SAMN06265379_1046 [Saccharicrinis carchari]|uniref:Uncharacterized protein n=1 Tax=Saccharicrinis carchari TaxID=1168039 RepID=A0A521CX38_SACCC|nr:hypothetical protein [Saccharicrinis carchari]SMO64005.1 hypothetical protein SAMN06265379_1046 [Saccharicrinis carchari]
MSDVSKHITIPNDVAYGNDLDYLFLKEKGLQYIEELSGKVWTDYNTHDPGITMLEMLCYAITDLASRIDMPIENILTPEKDGSLEDQFFKALQILPGKPVTENDYRKLFIDIDGVKNCWLQKFKKTVYVDCKNDLLSYDAKDFDATDKQAKSEFDLNGLYTILIDFNELSDDDFPSDTDKEAEIERIKNEIVKCYHKNRNLCEDLVQVSRVETQAVKVCASIELDQEADEELVHARILRIIDKYFSPDLWFYSLQQMFNKGYTSDQIFEGPVLKNGFIDPVELENAILRSEVRLSDIIRLIMNIDGVKVVKDISINDCTNPVAEDKDVWLLCIDEGKKPTLCDKSAFSYYKGVLPVNVNEKTVKKHLEQLEAREVEKQELAKIGQEIQIPEGEYMKTGVSTTVQNDFPETYGIGQIGLPPRSTVARKAQAKQLKGYLLFFDQVFATYFAHLDKVKDLLSVDQKLTNTYFTQAVNDVKGFEYLVNDYPIDDDEELTKKLLSDLDDHIARKNELLDHLIARFAEKFSEFSFLMKELYGDYAAEAIVKAKEVFLSEYGEIEDDTGTIVNKGISNWRGSAFNYFEQPASQLWDTDNIAGAQKRIARLCGMKNFNRRNLSESYVEVYDYINSDGEKVYRWRITTSDGIKILSATDDYKTARAAVDELYLSVVRVMETAEKTIEEAFKSEVTDGEEIGNFKIQISPEGMYSFDVINHEADPDSSDWIIARQFLYYTKQRMLKKALLKIIRFLTTDFTEEGMFIMEHILLRPDVNQNTVPLEQFMPVCTDNCESCHPLDPYSYRVTVVLPGWTYRFGNHDFRNFMEDLIRKELPAHVLARICWIGHRTNSVPDAENEMLLFEEAYKAFLLVKSGLGQKQDEEKLKTFIDILTELHSIYPSGKLIDCDDEKDEQEGKIILGRTNIGNL